MDKFKPKKTEKEVISIRIEATLLEQIDKIAGLSDISRNELIVQCIDYALSNMDKH
ncbi:MAG: ribbon-helix-helix protein, CopG family [Eubacterium sp.]